MALDLYTADIDSVSFNDIEGFLGMSSPVELRPTEGVLLDFKVSDSGDWVDSVTAFANTAGGILLLGVDGDKTKNNGPHYGTLEVIQRPSGAPPFPGSHRVSSRRDKGSGIATTPHIKARYGSGMPSRAL